MNTSPFLHSWRFARSQAAKIFASLFLLFYQAYPAAAADAANLESFTNPLKNGLNLITIFGFIAGCVMVMGGFLNARKDENWKMTVVYGIGVAGAVVLMKALFAMFGGNSANGIQGF
jgi:uncharacterized membrane protein